MADLRMANQFYTGIVTQGLFGTAFASGWPGLHNQFAQQAEPVVEGVPGSHPLERILDSLEKSGAERIAEFI